MTGKEETGMVSIQFSFASLLMVLGLGHLLNTIVAWVVHYLQHEPPWFCGVFRPIHIRAHHSPRLKLRDPVAHRRWRTLGHLLWLCMCGIVGAGYFALFSYWVAAVMNVEAIILAMSLYYFHREYEIPGSWLNRFRWFRRARALHRFHHGPAGWNRNYSIGGPVTGFLMDRLLATFHGVPIQSVSTPVEMQLEQRSRA